MPSDLLAKREPADAPVHTRSCLKPKVFSFPGVEHRKANICYRRLSKQIWIFILKPSQGLFIYDSVDYTVFFCRGFILFRLELRPSQEKITGNLHNEIPCSSKYVSFSCLIWKPLDTKVGCTLIAEVGHVAEKTTPQHLHALLGFFLWAPNYTCRPWCLAMRERGMSNARMSTHCASALQGLMVGWLLLYVRRSAYTHDSGFIKTSVRYSYARYFSLRVLLVQVCNWFNSLMILDQRMWYSSGLKWPTLMLYTIYVAVLIDTNALILR